MKSKNPYLIKAKNTSPYFSLIFGIVHSDSKAIADAFKRGADHKKLFLSKNPLLIDDDYYNNDDSEISYELIPSLDYVKKYSKPHIYEQLVLLSKPTDDQKAAILIKKIISHKKPEQSKELEDAFDNFLSPKMIDLFWEVKNMNDPFGADRWNREKTKVTFLHIACYHQNETAISYLLNKGANVNLRSTKNHQTAAHFAIESTPYKGDQSRGIRIIKNLLNHKANFDLKDSGHSETTAWHCAVSKFKIPELKIIFSDHQPETLSIIYDIKKKSPRLYEYWQSRTNGFSKYPLINDIYKYEKLQLIFSSSISKVKDGDSFFKNKSFKTALEKRYGFSSKRFSSIMSKNLFERDLDKVTIDGSMLEVADLLKEIYLDNPTPNFSDFLDVLETNSSTINNLASEAQAGYRTLEVSEFKKFLNSYFTSPQIKTLLSYNFKIGEHSTEVADTISMVKEFKKEFIDIFKRTPFAKIDNLIKLHNFVSAESNILSQENFKLEQETVYPNLKNLNKVNLPSSYGIKLAEENHELVRWGASMGHCIGGGSYSKKAKKGDCILMAITENNEPKFAIEIDAAGNLQQVQGKSHSKPNEEVLSAFIKGLKRIKVLNSRQTVKEWI